jgi:hypothetical protein
VTDATPSTAAIAQGVETLNGCLAALDPQEQQWLAGLLAHEWATDDVQGYGAPLPFSLALVPPGGTPGTATPAAGAGTAFLCFRFDTVFTTKIDWHGPGDEGPAE